MSNNDTILVRTADAVVTRRGGPRELEIEVLAHNVNLFLSQVEGILEKVPEETGDGKFKLTEFTVSAEISAKDALIWMGTGVEAEGKGGLTFKFERKG